MIQLGTQLEVADNSGAKIVECIKVLKKPKALKGRITDLMIVAVKSLMRTLKPKVKKGQVYRAIILETKSPSIRKDGSHFKSQRNCRIVLNAQGSPLGSRVQAIAPYELRRKHYIKILALSNATV